MPFDVSDFSNSERNLRASSGCSGGTRIGGPAPGGGLAAPDSGGAGVLSTTMPSNRGRGPAIAGRSIVSMNTTTGGRRTHRAYLGFTHAAKPIHQTVCGQPVHDQSIEEQFQTQRESKDPCSLYPRAARSERHVREVSRRTFSLLLPRGIHTSPRVPDGRCVFSKNGTAISPVITPRLVVSAAWKSW
jgi:hypothetical protein